MVPTIKPKRANLGKRFLTRREKNESGRHIGPAPRSGFSQPALRKNPRPGIFSGE
jgi:hypothetical protein